MPGFTIFSKWAWYMHCNVHVWSWNFPPSHGHSWHVFLSSIRIKYCAFLLFPPLDVNLFLYTGHRHRAMVSVQLMQCLGILSHSRHVWPSVLHSKQILCCFLDNWTWSDLPVHSSEGRCWCSAGIYLESRLNYTKRSSEIRSPFCAFFGRYCFNESYFETPSFSEFIDACYSSNPRVLPLQLLQDIFCCYRCVVIIFKIRTERWAFSSGGISGVKWLFNSSLSVALLKTFSSSASLSVSTTNPSPTELFLLRCHFCWVTRAEVCLPGSLEEADFSLFLPSLDILRMKLTNPRQYKNTSTTKQNHPQQQEKYKYPGIHVKSRRLLLQENEGRQQNSKQTNKYQHKDSSLWKQRKN